MLVQKCVGFIEGQGKKCPHLQTAIYFYQFLNLLFNIGTKCRTDLGQWLILMFVCRLNKWIGKIISYKLQNLSYPKGQHMNTIGGQVFEFSEFFIQNLHYVQDWPWTMINFGVCLSTLQMNWENLTTLMFIFSLCPRYILDTIQDFFINFRIQWQLNWVKNSTFP